MDRPVTDFADWQPEDSWDASDPPGVLLVNLRRRVAALDGGPVDYAAALEDITERLFTFLQATPELAPEIEARADLLFHDATTVGQRLSLP